MDIRYPLHPDHGKALDGKDHPPARLEAIYRGDAVPMDALR